jgi:hypothetical protein
MKLDNMILAIGVIFMTLMVVGCTRTPFGYAYDIVSLPFQLGHVILQRVP